MSADCRRLSCFTLEVYIDCEMSHGLDDIDGSTFDSDFGTGETTKSAVNIYMAERAAIFFQAVLTGRADDLDTRRLLDCENYRYGCSTTDDNDDCDPLGKLQSSKPDLINYLQCTFLE